MTKPHIKPFCFLKKNYLLIVFLFVSLASQAQTNPDSLWGVWQDETLADTTRLNALDDFAWEGYMYTQPDSAFYFAQMEHDYAKKKGLRKQMAQALNTQGYSFRERGDYSNAMDYHQRSLTLLKEIGDKKGIAGSLISIGSVYHQRKAYLKGIAECNKGYLFALEIGALEEQKEACECLYDGYKALGNGNKALEYHEKMLVLNDSLKSEETAKSSSKWSFKNKC